MNLYIIMLVLSRRRTFIHLNAKLRLISTTLNEIFCSSYSKRIVAEPPFRTSYLCYTGATLVHFEALIYLRTLLGNCMEAL